MSSKHEYMVPFDNKDRTFISIWLELNANDYRISEVKSYWDQTKSKPIVILSSLEDARNLKRTMKVACT